MLLAELDEQEAETYRDEIAQLTKHIRSKASPTPAYIYGTIAAAIAWYMQASKGEIALSGVAVSLLFNVVRSIDLAILESKLQGAQTRLMLLRSMARRP